MYRLAVELGAETVRRPDAAAAKVTLSSPQNERHGIGLVWHPGNWAPALNPPSFRDPSGPTHTHPGKLTLHLIKNWFTPQGGFHINLFETKIELAKLEVGIRTGCSSTFHSCRIEEIHSKLKTNESEPEWSNCVMTVTKSHRMMRATK